MKSKIEPSVELVGSSSVISVNSPPAAKTMRRPPKMIEMMKPRMEPMIAAPLFPPWKETRKLEKKEMIGDVKK